MSDYKGDFADYKGGGGGGRLFALIMLFVLVGLVLIYALLSEPNSPARDELPMDTTAPTAVAVAPGTSVNVEQAAPAVNVESNVNVEQAPPAAAPAIVVDNTAALMAADSARDARAAADTALAGVNALASRVAAVETRTAVVDDLSPALLVFEQRTAQATADIDLIVWGLLAVLGVLMLLSTAVGWLTMRPPTLPRGYTIDQHQIHSTPPRKLTRALLRPNNGLPEVNRRSELFRTVPNLFELPLDGNEEPPAELRDLWRKLHAHGMSKTMICKLFYGSKGASYRWVRAAFDEATIIQEEVQQDD